VKLTEATLFATGYVIGTRAGRERYAQILDAVAKASQRLEEFSSHRPPGRPDHSSGRPKRGSGSPGAPVGRNRRRSFDPRPRPGPTDLEA
jgi:hypothetical protein